MSRHNPLWLRVTAHVLQRPVITTTVGEASMLGAAITAAVASRAYGSLAQAAAVMVHRDRVIDPDRDLAGVYDDGFATYCETTRALTGVLHALSHVAESARPMEVLR